MSEHRETHARVMIADSDRVSARVLERSLQRAGYQVVVANDGREALEKIHADEALDAILADWTMPRVDGIELIAEARQHIHPRPAVLIVSAQTSGQAREHALAAGADAFITKPLLPDVVLSALAVALQKRTRNK